MSSEIASRTPARAARLRSQAARRQLRVAAIQLIGPTTILAGVVWAIAQPYRIAFLHPEGKDLYYFLVQPPLLVVAVGLAYALLIAPGLVRDVDGEGDGSSR